MLGGVKNLRLFSSLACGLSLIVIVALAGGSTATPPPIPLAFNGEIDSDGDGLSDAEELRLGLDPFDPTDGLADEDGDGLTLAEEIHAGTDSHRADTDGDGLSDLVEIIRGTNPADAHDPTSITATSSPAQPAGLLSPKPVKASSGIVANGATAVFGSTSSGSSGGDDDINPWVSGGLTYPYAPKKYNHVMAIKEISEPKPGSYLLIWQQAGLTGASGLPHQYAIEIKNSRGRCLHRWISPQPVTPEYKTAILALTLTAADCRTPITLSLTPIEDDTRSYNLYGFGLMEAGLEIDYDRDGRIERGEFPPRGKKFRYWINDDTDAEEYDETTDLPEPSSSKNNATQPGINGLRDLVDFFPVNLNIAKLLHVYRPEAGYHYQIRQSDAAVQLVLTSLRLSVVGEIHRDPDLKVFGPTGTQDLKAAETLAPEALNNLITIPPTFLTTLRERGYGVVLVEGRKPTQNPLELIIEKDGVDEIKLQLPLALGPVESMYRHLNLTEVPRSLDGTSVAPPIFGRPTEGKIPEGLPDRDCNDRWFVLVHGYNVDGNKARSWPAEFFKRLYALGSHARFVGVTWNGDTGLDYHKAVYHAFQTGDLLGPRLYFIDPRKTILAAHSLGNMVACQAIQSGKLVPARYFMINAAVPIEAISPEDSTSTQTALMTEGAWRPYSLRLTAAAWSESFTAPDRRAGVSWRNAFSLVKQKTSALNYYSSGENITNCPAEISTASVLSTLWAGRSIDYGVWKTQELLKGVGWARSLASVAMERSQAGWGFNPQWRGNYVPGNQSNGLGGYYEKLAPEIAAQLLPAQLLPNPFFAKFLNAQLLSTQKFIGDLTAGGPRVKYDLLARAIPSLSYAAGAEPMPLLGSFRTGQTGTTNFNLETEGRVATRRWPTAGHTQSATAGHWLHSDCKNVALPFVHPFYLSMITQGDLR